MAISSRNDSRIALFDRNIQCKIEFYLGMDESDKRPWLAYWAQIKNSDLYKAVRDLLIKSVDEQELLSAQKRHLAANYILEVPKVGDLLENLARVLNCGRKLEQDALRNHLQNSLINLLSQDVKSELSNAITEYVAEKYKIVDNRKQVDDMDVRRLDSLARLFVFPSRVSVCNAVAIHENELIISYNISNEDVKNYILEKLHNRLELMHSFFDQARSLAPQHALEPALVNDLVERLFQNDTNLPRDIMEQALGRLSDMVRFNDEPFDDDEVRALYMCNKKTKVLFPSYDAKNNKSHILAASCTPGDNHFNYIEINKTYVNTAVNHFHAEQLLAYYIFKFQNANQYSDENPLVIGINKLTCPTCCHNLKEFPVKTRGTHDDYDVNTISLLTDKPLERSAPTTPRRYITVAERSPQKSAEKNRDQLAGDATTTRSKRKLNFSGEIINEHISETTTITRETVGNIMRETVVVQKKIDRTSLNVYQSSASQTFFGSNRDVVEDGSDEEFYSASEDESISNEGFESSDSLRSDRPWFANMGCTLV